jgi:hypothetical protein
LITLLLEVELVVQLTAVTAAQAALAARLDTDQSLSELVLTVRQSDLVAQV